MEPDRRNPWIILGIDYGVTGAAASSAFARASRRIKRAESAPFDLDDLTWALNEIEAAEQDPDIAIHHYRVPADPSAYEPPLLSAAAEGLCNPPRPPAPRITPTLSEEDRAELVAWITRSVTAQLLTTPAPVRCPYDIFD